MKLVSFSLATPLGRTGRVGCVQPDGSVVDLSLAHRLRLLAAGMAPAAAQRMAAAVVPPDMVAFIEGGDLTLEAAAAAAAWVEQVGVDTGPDGERVRHPPDAAGATLGRLPVVVDPPMLRDFMAFETHLRNIYPRLGRDIPQEWYELPVYYKGNPSSLGADGDDIAVPSYAGELDFEFEFAAVIGRPGADIAREDAAGHIFGYTIYNDFSARQIQSREMAVGLGPAKGKDFRKAHVLGPWLVTADEVGDVYDLRMHARVNGQPWSESNTGTMHWKFEDMIAHASRDEPLRCGEVFGSGTVGDGSGAERGESLVSGDEVELTIERLGTLRNRVR